MGYGAKKMLTGTISSKGQVTIPKKIREYLKVDNSDKVVFIPLEEGKVMITSEKKPVQSLFGMLKHRKPSKPVSMQEIETAIRKRRLERSER